MDAGRNRIGNEIFIEEVRVTESTNERKIKARLKWGKNTIQQNW